jgi:hypothetical protein
MDPARSFPPAQKQVLGKRKHGGQPIMRVPNQFRNTGGSVMPVFHQKPSEISLDSKHVTYHSPNLSSPQPVVEPKKQVTISDHSFVMNTVDSMKNNPRARRKRGPEPATAMDSADPVPTILPTRQGRKPPKPPKPPRFRPSRPVQISDQVYMDIWVRILSFCEPKFVLEARTINKHFNQLLTEHSAIWRECRLNHYGRDMPGLPTGLTEKQYVELLAGRGCQHSKCSKGETLKVHWTFQVRLCADCLFEKTMRVSSDHIPGAPQIADHPCRWMNFPSPDDMPCLR